MIGFRDAKNVMFGVGQIEVDGKALSDVPLCFDFRSAQLGYQFTAAASMFRQDVCFDKIAFVTGKFASPWGTFHLEPKAQWTALSTGGGGLNITATPLWEFVEDSNSWQYSWLRSNQQVVFEAPYSFEEAVFVGRSVDIGRSLELNSDMNVVSRRSSVSLLGKMSIQDVYPLFCGALSIAGGAPLRIHSHQTGRNLTFFGNSYLPEEKSSQALFFSGYPMSHHELTEAGYIAVLNCALKKLSEKGDEAGPGSHEVLQYLEARTSSNFSESKILTAFAFLETFCEKHLKEKDYPVLFGVSKPIAKALNLYRNDLIHNNFNPVQATEKFANRLKTNPTSFYTSMRTDVLEVDSLAALNFVLSLCDDRLLQWIGYDGLSQMFIPTKEEMLRNWQPISQYFKSKGTYPMTDFQMGPLTLSVKSYADDVSEDFYEANWLVLDVKCPTEEGDVAFRSPCLMTTDVFDFMDEINDLLAGQGRQAYLVSLEPQIDVRIARGDGPDVFALEVELTPNAEDDEDIYDAAAIVTRADVEAMAKQAAAIVKAFPVRGIQDT